MIEIVSVEAEPLDLPLSEPFEISLGTRYETNNGLVTVDTDNGKRGYGEGSPIPPITGETRDVAIEMARASAALLEGEPIEEYRRLTALVRDTFPGAVSSTFVVETTILYAYCRERDIALAELFGGPPAPIQSDLTIPILPPGGCRTGRSGYRPRLREAQTQTRGGRRD